MGSGGGYWSPIGEALGSFIIWLSPSSIFDVVEDHCLLPCEIAGWPSHFCFRKGFSIWFFLPLYASGSQKALAAGGWFVILLLFYSIFPVQSRFNEDFFKKNTPTSPTNEALHEYINDIVSTLGALQQNRTLRELTFSGDVDDMTVLASTLKVNTTLQRIESQGDIFPGHLELLFQELLFFFAGGREECAFFLPKTTGDNSGAVGFQTSQICVVWIWSFHRVAMVAI